MTTHRRSLPGPLAGVRVLDLTTVLAGPFATHLLADQGADVVKIEAPGGDITRTVGRSHEPGMASIFQHINKNKRSLVLDLKRPEGRTALLRLAADADAFVFNMRADAMDRLGLGLAAVRAVNPRIVYCGFAGYGRDGAYAGRPAYDDLIQGLTGIPDLAARAGGGEPRYAPMSMADRIVGLYGANALLMALFRQARTGEGAAVEVPMFEAMAHFVLVEHMFYRSFEPPLGPAANPRGLDPNRKPLPTRDGHVCLLPYSDRQWQTLFGLLGRADMQADPRFATFTGRLEHVRELYAFLAAAMREETTAHWLARFAEADIPAAPMNSLEELLDDPHLRSVDFWQPLTKAGGTRFIHMDSPLGWNEWPRGTLALEPAPLLGQHSAEILAEAGFTPAEVAAMACDGVTLVPA
ncbi:CaiB/BaiF CoA transferase family protein [Stella sp.]|uniref:CaiB/BaiF CoA transferase family protein n=1 Tax=Stella sp. TaxID=2912054 RepID=UPI0035B4AAEA